MYLSLEIPGTPAPWTAQMRNAERSLSFQRMQAWQEQIRAHARQKMGRRAPTAGAVRLDVVFYLPTPGRAPTGAEKRRQWQRQHILRPPDLDNMRKAFSDALKGIVYLDDGQVVAGETVKTYIDEPEGLTVAWVLTEEYM